MRMSGKMILLFSIVTATLILVNTLLSIQSELRTLLAHEQESLTVTADQMRSEIEQNIAVMEYGIEEMTQDNEFMASFAVIARLGEAGEHTSEYLKAQTVLSNKLYHQPLNDHFYSVNVMTAEGFILSSHFQKFEVIESYSDEIMDRLANMPWLQEATMKLNVRQVVTPHPDPWDVYRDMNKSVSVYTVWAHAIYHGQKIGYLEVNALSSDLNRIFSVSGMNGFQAAAIFSQRDNPYIRELYREQNNTIDYSAAVLGEMVTCADENGVNYYVVSVYSKALQLMIYAAQRTDVYASSVQTAVTQHAVLGLFILLAAVSVIVLISLSVTRSMNRLTEKIVGTGAASLLDESQLLQGQIAKVTNPRDREVRAMEDSFDELLLTLRRSTRTELQLRESTLRSQLNALQAQINPHFVYNTLNIISAKSMEAGNEEVIDICDHFAQMLRYSTDLRSKTATLREEIENARNYLLLAKARYEDKLTYEIQVPEAFMGQVLPKLSLQPMVENALSHGYQGSRGGIHISITGQVDGEGRLHLILRDNGSGFDENVLLRLNQEFSRIESGEFAASAENTSAHIGLVNTYRRLYYFSNRGIQMLLRNENGAVIEMIVNASKQEG